MESPKLASANSLKSSKKQMIIFAVWATLISVPLVALMVLHAPFNPVDGNGVAELVGAQKGAWAIVHVLASGCGCSRRVAKHLTMKAAGTHNSAREYVVVLGGSIAFESELQKAGYEVIHRDSDQLSEKLGINGVPLLVVIKPDGSPGYSGGYSKHSVGTEWSDEEVIHTAMLGSRPETLPVYGCAVGARMMKKSDPFGLKYKITSSNEMRN